MALTIGELVAYITADNRGFRRGLSRSERDMERFQRDANGRLRDMRGRFVREGEDAGEGFGSTLARAAGRALKAGFGAAGAVLAPLQALPWSLAAIAATAVAAAPLLASAGAAIAEVGSAAIAAAPALLALYAANKIATASLKALFAEGTAAREALSPLASVLEKATEAGSQAAAKGIKPLAEELRKLVQPTVTKYMVDVGKAANVAQKRFLGWAKSADGLRTIRGILEPISASMSKLAPKVSDLAISFTRMLGRIMGVSTAAGTSGLGKVLEWLTEKLDQVNAASVQGGLDKLKSTMTTIRDVVVTVVGWIQTLIDAYQMYTKEFGLVADAISVAAIIFGGPITAIIGAVGLLIRHFDEVKAAWEKLKAAFQGEGGGGPLATALQDIKAAAEIVGPALMKAGKDIWEAIGPPLREIGALIKNEVVPAFAEFARAAAPLVAWLIGVLAPVVKAVFLGVLGIIKGTLNIIIGVFRVFTGILTGDWSKVWSGIQKILQGAMQILGALVKTGLRLIWATIKGTLSALAPLWNHTKEIAVRAFRAMMSGLKSAVVGGARAVYNAVSSVKNRITGFFSGAGRWLVNAGRAILDGLISGIRSAIGRVKSELGRVTGMIPSWKGPMSVDLKLLEPSGEALMSGLMDGISAAVPNLRGLLGGVTGDIASAMSAQNLQPAPASALAAAANSSARELLVRVLLDVEGGEDAFKDVVRGWVRVDGGGVVQTALGDT